MFRARRGRDEHAYLVEPLEIVEVEIGLLDRVGEGRGELGALGGRQVECSQNERKARTKVHPVMDNGGVLRTRHRTPCSILLKRAQECNQRGPIRWCKGEEAVACQRYPVAATPPRGLAATCSTQLSASTGKAGPRACPSGP